MFQCHSTEIRVLRSNRDSYSCFLALDRGQAVSGGHAADAVFTTAVPTLIPQGNVKRENLFQL